MPQDIETSKIHGNATNLLMDKICRIYFDNLIVTTFGRGESGFFWGGGGEFKLWMSLLETIGGANQLSYKALG